MELTAALPSLMSNSKLSVILTTDEMNIINDVFLSTINKNLKTNLCVKKTWYDMSRFDHAVYKVLKTLVKRLIDVFCTSFLQRKYTSMTLALFLCHVRYFLEQVLYRMYLTSEQERCKDLHYRKLWHCQKKSIEDVARFTVDLERQQINHRKTLEDVVERYRKNIAAIDDIDKRRNEYITSTNMRYEKKQIAVCKAWDYERNEMQITLENVIDDLEFLKDLHIKLEQTIRKQKLTTESKLLAIITKYDTEIGSRCRTLEKLNEIYKYDRLEMYDLEKEMRRQEKEYLVFIKRKEETANSLATFEQVRSAKIIQRWWRKIFWR